VRAALDASSFPWGIVPGQVTIHVVHGVGSRAAPNRIWIDADSLSAGRFSWGEIQHEYAHVVDFALLDDGAREQLNLFFGTRGWLLPGADHDEQGAERFADTLAAAYWPSPDNVATAFAKPAVFRALLAQLLPAGPQLRRSATAATR
jgi:hypothetical protein